MRDRGDPQEVQNLDRRCQFAYAIMWSANSFSRGGSNGAFVRVSAKKHPSKEGSADWCALFVSLSTSGGVAISNTSIPNKGVLA